MKKVDRSKHLGLGARIACYLITRCWRRTTILDNLAQDTESLLNMLCGAAV
jgi:hypothetical protein